MRSYIFWYRNYNKIKAISKRIVLSCTSITATVIKQIPAQFLMWENLSLTRSLYLKCSYRIENDVPTIGLSMNPTHPNSHIKYHPDLYTKQISSDHTLDYISSRSKRKLSKLPYTLSFSLLRLPLDHISSCQSNERREF